MSQDPIQVNFSTLDSLKGQMLDLGVALDNADRPLGNSYDQIHSGAGQFASYLQSGAAEFLLAWRTAFDTMSDGASLVGNNIGKTIVDLTQVDTNYCSDIVL